MIRSVPIKRLTLGSLFTLLFVGSAGWLVPLSMVSGIVGLFGGDVIKTNDEYIHGWQALLAGLVGGPVAAFFLSLFAALVYFPGLWLFSLFRPLSLTYVELKPVEPDAMNS